MKILSVSFDGVEIQLSKDTIQNRFIIDSVINGVGDRILFVTYEAARLYMDELIGKVA